MEVARRAGTGTRTGDGNRSRSRTGTGRRSGSGGTSTGKGPLAERPATAVPARVGAFTPGRPGYRWLRRVVAGLLLLGVAGFLIDGADRPADPHLVPAHDPGAGKGAPGVGTATLSVAPGAGHACVLEAVTPAQQEWGLMERRSVAPYAGMAFVFAAPSSERFYMKDTLIPLSIAWFDGAGRWISATTMPPCPPATAACPTYGPSRPYQLAVEVPAGRLGALGLGPGSTAHLGGPCA